MGVSTRNHEPHRRYKQGKRLSKHHLLERLKVSHSPLKRDIDLPRHHFPPPLECERSENRHFYSLIHGQFESSLDRHIGTGFSGNSDEWTALRFTEHAARWVADAQ